MSSNHGRRYLVSKIQDGSTLQLVGAYARAQLTRGPAAPRVWKLDPARTRTYRHATRHDTTYHQPTSQPKWQYPAVSWELTGNSNISELWNISSKFLYIFGVKLSSSGTSNFLGRRRLLEIQDGSQITESTNISETMTYIIKILTANLRHSTNKNGKLAGSVPRRFQ